MEKVCVRNRTHRIPSSNKVQSEWNGTQKNSTNNIRTCLNSLWPDETRVRATKTIARQMSTGVGKPPRTRRALRQYYHSPGQRFLLSETGGGEYGHTSARSAVWRGVSCEARAPAPLPSDKPGATPPGDAYAPLGAGASWTPPAAPRSRRPDGPPHLRIVSQLHVSPCDTIDDFRLLKKTRKPRLRNSARDPDTAENNEPRTERLPF